METGKHGGARKGAGRPPTKVKQRLVTVSVALTPAQRRMLEKRAKANDESVSQVARRLFDESVRLQNLAVIGEVAK